MRQPVRKVKRKRETKTRMVMKKRGTKVEMLTVGFPSVLMESDNGN